VKVHYQYQRQNLTPGANFASGNAGVVDTGGKFATGANDNGGKFAAVIKFFAAIKKKSKRP
jgi:hypothetical protein